MGPIQSQLNQASAPHTLDTSLAPLAWHPSRPCSQEFRAATTAQTREKSKQEKNVAMEHILSLVIWGAKVSVGKFEKNNSDGFGSFPQIDGSFPLSKKSARPSPVAKFLDFLLELCRVRGHILSL